MNQDYDWIVPIVFCVLVTSFLARCHRVEAEEPPPITPREITLSEARAAVLATPAPVLECYQERVHGRTHVCITESEWRRQHADD